MSTKCVYCHQKKGKRTCPALGGNICSPCCGEYRVAVIHCPKDCVYLTNHEGYQRKKIAHTFSQDRFQLAQTLQDQYGKEGEAFLNLLDIITYSYFHHQPTAQDHEVIIGFEKLRNSLSPIQTPNEKISPFGDFLQKELEAFLKNPVSPRETALSVLDEHLIFLKNFSPEPIHSNRFLRGIMGFVETYFSDLVERLKKDRPLQEKRILTIEDEIALQKKEGRGFKSGF